MKMIFIGIIKLYQLLLSPFLGKNCRFYPTCSAYAIEAIEVKGIMGGSWLGFKRITKCHPFSSGGYDPVVTEKSECTKMNSQTTY